MRSTVRSASSWRRTHPRAATPVVGSSCACVSAASRPRKRYTTLSISVRTGLSYCFSLFCVLVCVVGWNGVVLLATSLVCLRCWLLWWVEWWLDGGGGGVLGTSQQIPGWLRFSCLPSVQPVCYVGSVSKVLCGPVAAGELPAQLHPGGTTRLCTLLWGQTAANFPQWTP